tara:strand:+ start:2651 stop:3298 length:648 start_codon:yes stop_codon:yes gene_type:complete
MKQKVQVVMLPTEDKSQIFIHRYKDLRFDNESNLHGNSQHLYITVSQDVEPIKEGWVIDNDNELKYVSSSVINTKTGIARHIDDTPFILDGCRKVIATTDSKLTIKVLEHIGRDFKEIAVPQVQQSFLKEYVANPDGEFKIEYKKVNIRPDNSLNYFEYGAYKYDTQLKINQDNEVNITSVEKKMYSRKEVEALIYKVVKDNVGEYVDRWIEEYV